MTTLIENCLDFVLSKIIEHLWVRAASLCILLVVNEQSLGFFKYWLEKKKQFEALTLVSVKI